MVASPHFLHRFFIINIYQSSERSYKGSGRFNFMKFAVNTLLTTTGKQQKFRTVASGILLLLRGLTNGGFSIFS